MIRTEIELNDLIELLSAFYTNVYYFDLYAQAIKLKESGDVKSIISGYVMILDRYKRAYRNTSVQKKLFRSLHDYINAKFGHISIMQFIDSLVRAFVPERTFGAMEVAKRDSLSRIILARLIDKIDSYARTVGQELIMSRTSGSSVDKVKGVIEKIIRETIHSFHIEIIDGDRPEARDGVSMRVYKMTLKKLEEIINQKNDLAKTNKTLNTNIQRLLEQIRIRDSIIQKFQRANPVTMPVSEFPKSHPESPSTSYIESEPESEYKHESEPESKHEVPISISETPIDDPISITTEADAPSSDLTDDPAPVESQNLAPKPSSSTVETEYSDEDIDLSYY